MTDIPGWGETVAMARQILNEREDVSWKCCGQWWGLVQTHCPVCGSRSHASGPPQRERIEEFRSDR